MYVWRYLSMPVVHYHGGPIWGGDEIVSALYKDGGALVSFRRTDQIKKIAKLKCSLVLDNGAFSTWRANNDDDFDWDAHWTKYYMFVLKWIGRIDWFVVPDVIEGTEQENDDLVSKVPSSLKSKAVPVWHSNESISRLLRLCEKFSLVAIGCCGDETIIRSKSWVLKMDEVFNEIYIKRNMDVNIHGLRMLDGRALSKYPFYSADSTNVAINVPKTKARLPNITCKLARTAIMRHTIEMVSPPTVAEYKNKIKFQESQKEIQLDMFKDM